MLRRSLGGFSIVLLCFAFPLRAQTDSIKVYAPRIKMGFFADINSVSGDFSRLNEVLAQEGFPTVQDSYQGASFGFSMRSAKKDSYTTFALSYLRTDPDPLYDNGRTKDTRVSMLTMNFGYYYDLVAHPKWLVYPYFGMGGGTTSLVLYDNISYPASFTTSIATLGAPSSKYFSDLFVYANVGAGFERKISLGWYNFYLGAGGGYRLSTNAAYYEAYHNYTDSPSVRLSGLEWNIRMRFEISRKGGIRMARDMANPKIK